MKYLLNVTLTTYDGSSLPTVVFSAAHNINDHACAARASLRSTELEDASWNERSNARSLFDNGADMIAQK